MPSESNKAISAKHTHVVSNTNFSPDIKSFVLSDRKEERQAKQDINGDRAAFYASESVRSVWSNLAAAQHVSNATHCNYCYAYM